MWTQWCLVAHATLLNRVEMVNWGNILQRSASCETCLCSCSSISCFHGNFSQQSWQERLPVWDCQWLSLVFLCSWVWTLLGALPHLPNLSLLLAIPHRGGMVATCRFSLFDSLDAHKVRVWMHLCSLLFCQSQGWYILSIWLQLVHYLSAVTVSDKSDKSDTKFSGCQDFCALQLANSLSV